MRAQPSPIIQSLNFSLPPSFERPAIELRLSVYDNGLGEDHQRFLGRARINGAAPIDITGSIKIPLPKRWGRGRPSSIDRDLAVFLMARKFEYERSLSQRGIGAAVVDYWDFRGWKGLSSESKVSESRAKAQRYLDALGAPGFFMTYNSNDGQQALAYVFAGYQFSPVDGDPDRVILRGKGCGMLVGRERAVVGMSKITMRRSAAESQNWTGTVH